MEPRPGEGVGRFATAITTLQADRTAVQVFPALQENGIRAILLKGPSIAAWLYADGARSYQDVDVLVEDGSFDAAAAVLRTLGFRRGRPDWKELAWVWSRAADGASVDLHRGLVGAGEARGALWDELTRHTGVVEVGGIEIEVLAGPALAFVVVLHAAKHGTRSPKPLEDLSRALERTDEACWHEAAEIARRSDAIPAFASGLRLDPRGARLADQLGLPRERPLEVALQGTDQPELVLGIEHLASSGGIGARARFLARKLGPAPAELRRRSALARRGAVGLCLAYLWRPLSMLARLPGALLAWRRARRENARAAR